MFATRYLIPLSLVLVSLIPESQATTVSFYQGSTYSLPSPSGNSGGLRLQGGGMILGLGRGKLTVQTGGAYLTQVLNGADSGHLLIPLWFRLRLAQSLFVRAGAGINYQLDRLNANVRALDYGLMGGAGFDVPLSFNMGLVVAADYYFSLANTAASGTLNQNQFLGWVGLRFGRP
ncbi:MAG: hypothetical protein KA715_11435 [Xanthomonadaceae bacterium]|nr:hypothetical protein [Xanthomonadaceae bacterium]